MNHSTGSNIHLMSISFQINDHLEQQTKSSQCQPPPLVSQSVSQKQPECSKNVKFRTKTPQISIRLHKLFNFFPEICNFSTNLIRDICDKYELCQSVVRMLSEYSQNVGRMQSKCSQIVANMQPECSQNVARMQLEYSQNVAKKQPKCS